MEDLLKCSICLKIFTDPRVLPCQHTFCLKPCLEQIYDRILQKVKCPLCRFEHCINKGNIDTIPKNLTIQSLLEMPDNTASGSKLVCPLCDDAISVSIFCACCKQIVCHPCNNIHMKQTKARLGKLVNTVKRHMDMDKDTCRKIVKGLSLVDNKKSGILLSVNNLFNSLIAILQKRKSDLVIEVNKAFEEDIKTLKILQETKEVDVAVLSSSIHSIMNSMEREDISHVEVFSLLNSVQQTLPTQSSDEVLQSVDMKNREFSYDIQQAQDYITTIGVLKCSSEPRRDSTSSFMRTDRCAAKLEQSPGFILSSTITREKTYVLSRPAKCISFDIAFNEPVCLSNAATDKSLHYQYQKKLNPIITFGIKGVKSGEFIWPRGIVIDNANEKIIVADSSNHRVQIFNDHGQCEKIISEIIQNTESNNSSINKMNFDCLSGISVTRDEKIICSDRYNHRVVVIDIDGRLLNEMGKSSNGESLLSYPWGIAVDGRGNTLVCDKDNHRIQVFSAKGEYIKQIGSFGRQPGLFDNPHYLSICSNTQNIFVSDTSNHRIQIFSKDGEFLSSFTGNGPPKFHLKYPRGIAVDSEGNVLVCDSGNNRISIFTGDGKLIHMIGSHGSHAGQFKGLEGIAVFKDGRIVVSDRDNHRIQIF